MLLSTLLSGGDLKDVLVQLLLTLPVIILALSVHETAHGYVAWKCGDPTAHNLGRLTLNPLKHLDPIGFVCMMVFGYGWAKPVPINTRYFRNPKRDMAICAAAGPLSNLLMGLFSAALLGVVQSWYSYLFYTVGEGFFLTCVWLLVQLLYLGAAYNFLLMAFNLIPIPPFDGSRIALAFLPPRIYFGVMRYERQIMFGLLIAILVLDNFGFSPFGLIANNLTNAISSPISRALWENAFLPMLRSSII